MIFKKKKKKKVWKTQKLAETTEDNTSIHVHFLSFPEKILWNLASMENVKPYFVFENIA